MTEMGQAGIVSASPTDKAGAPSGHNVQAPYVQLDYVERGPVVRLTLNRPHVRNALSIRLSDELIHALERITDSTSLKVVVIQGAGGTFCAGDDISDCRADLVHRPAFVLARGRPVLPAVGDAQHPALHLEHAAGDVGRLLAPEPHDQG